jgi:hypothetical protein
MNPCPSHNIRFEGEECPQCAVDSWKSQKWGGCLTVFILWPLYMAGAWLGAIFSAFWHGFKDTRNLWDDCWKWIRARRPGKKEEAGG